MEQIIKAAEDLKAAADILIEAARAQGPITPPDPKDMDDGQRQRWRQFVNAIAETEFSQRLTTIDEQVKDINKNLEELVEDAVDRAKSDLGQWDELDPGEVGEAVEFVRRAPDACDIEEAVSELSDVKTKVEEIEDTLRGMSTDAVEEVESDLEGLKADLSPLLEMINAVKASARPKVAAAG
jgi:phage shock protein A